MLLKQKLHEKYAKQVFPLAPHRNSMPPYDIIM